MKSVSTVLLAISAILLVQGVTLADVTCNSCRVTVHTNGPTTCPLCGKAIGVAPAPNPYPNPNPYPAPNPYPNPNPNPGFDSGFKLGVSVVPMSWGLRVVSVEPGTPAMGTLFVDDIMQEAAYRDDYGKVQRFGLRVPHDIETVKHYAGSSKQVALKVRRPSGQMRYLFASFIPNQTGPVRTRMALGATAADAAPATGGSGQVTVDTTGAAAAMFGGGTPGGQQGNPNPPQPGGNPSIPGQQGQPGESPQDLFRQP